MSKNTFSLQAETRNDIGKGASRRLRHENKVPAVVYGGEGEPVSITIGQFEILKCLNNDSFYSQIIDININGEVTETILRDLQRHPYKPTILHADFQRIVRGQKLTVNVPLHFINMENSVGVKASGIANQHIIDIEVSCRPGDLPESIIVDVEEIGIGDTIHLSQIIMPEGVTIVALDNDESEGGDANQIVYSVHAPKAEKVEEEVVESEDEAEATEEKKDD